MWEGNDIRGMVRTLVMNCHPFHLFPENHSNYIAEIPCTEIVVGVEPQMYKFSLSVSQYNYWDISLQLLVDADWKVYLNTRDFQV